MPFLVVDGAHIVLSVVQGSAGSVVLFAAFAALLIVVCDTPYEPPRESWRLVGLS
jgi:hypothetical protein